MIKVNITGNKSKDTKVVAKMVLIDENDRVLFLKRSNYMDKFAGEWDLPGGHIIENESLTDGLKREVFEETQLKVTDETYLTNIENLHFFYAKYNSQPIKLSDEHVDYIFFEKSQLNLGEKFQKVALKALERYND